MREFKQKERTSSDIYFKNNMKICNELYLLSHLIGSGNFGEVFLALIDEGPEVFPEKHQFAIKIEKQCAGKPIQLINEIQILKIITADPEAYGFPRLYEHGIEKGNYFMVMDLLGPNLSDLMKLCGGKFTETTTTILAIQMFQRVQYIHSKGFLCRDIKPENFLMGCGNDSSTLFLIDFGLSKRYRDDQSGLHRPYKEDRDFNGTLRYASICSQLKIEQSRRDDLESLCYVIIYMLNGTLPWQHFNSVQTTESRQKWILNKKMKTSPEVLCEGLPIQICNIFQYCLDLQYYEDPDYNFIQSELQQMSNKFNRTGFNYDWEILTEAREIEKQELTTKITPSEFRYQKKFMEEIGIESAISEEVISGKEI